MRFQQATTPELNDKMRYRVSSTETVEITIFLFVCWIF